MSNQKEEPKKEIPEVIYDSTTGRKYQRGKFLGKVSWIGVTLLPKAPCSKWVIFVQFHKEAVFSHVQVEY